MSRATRVTHTRYRHPHRPLPIRLINRFGNGLDGTGSSRGLSDTALLKEASRLEGLSDFGDASFRPGLRELVSALASEARLTPVGRWITRKRLVGSLRNRLRLVKPNRLATPSSSLLSISVRFFLLVITASPFP